MSCLRSRFSLRVIFLLVGWCLRLDAQLPAMSPPVFPSVAPTTTYEVVDAFPGLTFDSIRLETVPTVTP